MLRVKSPQNLGAGLVFILIGAAGYLLGRDLSFGTPARMGTGFFPLILSGCIFGLGVIVTLMGFTIRGPHIEPMKWRPITTVSLAIIAFGFAMTKLGLALSAVLLIFIAALARKEVKWRETAMLAVILALFSVGLFIYGLGQAMPAWWGD
jgi:Tripartite tricarboxylate transporter TctB family